MRCRYSNSLYRDSIKKIANAPYDECFLIEHVMREVHGTLDSLSVSQFRSAVISAQQQLKDVEFRKTIAAEVFILPLRPVRNEQLIKIGA